MNKGQKENQTKKTYYSVNSLQTELDALRTKVEESSTKEEILDYLKERIENLKSH